MMKHFNCVCEHTKKPERRIVKDNLTSKNDWKNEKNMIGGIRLCKLRFLLCVVTMVSVVVVVDKDENIIEKQKTFCSLVCDT